MKTYYIEIAPGWGKHMSLTDGKRGFNLKAESIEEAVEKTKETIRSNGWKSEAIRVNELNKRGHILKNPTFSEMIKAGEVLTDREAIIEFKN